MACRRKSSKATWSSSPPDPRTGSRPSIRRSPTSKSGGLRLSSSSLQSNFWSVFAETVSRFGEKTAVEIQRADRIDRFTYRQLNDMASAWASWLAQQGINAGDRCAILAANDAHWCAAYLGILKRGAVAVPLDTNYSAAQVATIVRDSESK